MLLERNNLRLTISYNILFLTAQPDDSNIYNLKEIYAVKNKRFSLNYGTWSKNTGLTINKNFIYNRRLNFDNAVVVLDKQREEVRLISFLYKI